MDSGSLKSIGDKLAAKRGGQLVNSAARETEGIVFYVYQVRNGMVREFGTGYLYARVGDLMRYLKYYAIPVLS